MTHVESLPDCNSDNEAFFDANETIHHSGASLRLHSSDAMLVDGGQVTQAQADEGMTTESNKASQKSSYEHNSTPVKNREGIDEARGGSDTALAAPLIEFLHINGCHNELAEFQRMTDTPPPPSPPPIPRIPRDCSTQLKQYDKFCRKAIKCVPQLSLASHRYWIGVLNLGVRVSKSDFHQKDFTWMMGNRLTCIETVWHSYSTQSGSVDFVLHCAGMKLDSDKDKKIEMRQLDYFNNRKVYLRAVDKDALDVEGKKLVPDEEPELIEIDD
ncbi:hypothetical protein K431DRAFT_46054 [Polychaeton citri CBS 116435]|uniref:Uncharacterized protein n=1 Tax=Polychaeton citri CBS 116435 TaxID=1314669 RepID=A0A9P4Q9W7_9PEZI|nr:hypothetical protein K431DRAFT_46054 [Polychaeton citri CBS 116435]